MDSNENDQFTAHLRSAVREAERLGYKPTRFKTMIEEYGGFDAVNRILASVKPSEGFTRLWELKRIDLTCEAIIVETKWRRFFDPETVGRSEKLLRESRYAFTPYADDAKPVTVLVADQSRSSTPSAGVNESIEDHAGTTVSDQRIGAFFRDVLHAPLANVRWSWGSVDERARRVFLRLWRMDHRSHLGSEVIQVLGPLRTQSLGRAERERHIELIRIGYTAYAVVCDKDSHESGVIRNFDRDSILRLGRLIEHSDSLLMDVVGAIPATSILGGTPPTSVEADLRDLDQSPLNETTRAALIDARLGQGRFRRELLRRWGGACAVTGCRVSAMLRASHCKPWCKSEHRERLDSNNGLVLSANLDALFDAGLITFDDAGGMLVSSVLSIGEQRELGLPAGLRRAPNARLCVYLAYHHEHVFLGIE